MMNKPLKLWLWFLLIIYTLQSVANLVSFSFLYLIYAAIHVAAVYFMLVKQKRAGFYTLFEVEIFGMVLNYRAGFGLPLTIASAVVVPAITLLLMQKDWGKFA